MLAQIRIFVMLYVLLWR